MTIIMLTLLCRPGSYHTRAENLLLSLAITREQVQMQHNPQEEEIIQQLTQVKVSFRGLCNLHKWRISLLEDRGQGQAIWDPVTDKTHQLSLETLIQGHSPAGAIT